MDGVVSLLPNPSSLVGVEERLVESGLLPGVEGGKQPEARRMYSARVGGVDGGGPFIEDRLIAKSVRGGVEGGRLGDPRR